METEVKLTKLAQCAGCGAKVGAGTLAKIFRRNSNKIRSTVISWF